jgi:ADP-ribosyl-[dinitrogen reductase] hydrolase
MSDSNRRRGVLLGAAAGDALGMPVEGLSHQNVRTYYRGIKDLRADEKRGDLAAGQWTHRTQRAIALARALADHESALTGERYEEALSAIGPLRRPPESLGETAYLAAAAGPLGVWWSATRSTYKEVSFAVRSALGRGDVPPEALAAAAGQAYAVHALLETTLSDLRGESFLIQVAEATARAEDSFEAGDRCSSRLRDLVPHLDEFPLDLHDRCGGAGPGADEAWPFAIAMFARNPGLIEATLLSAINVGGDAPTVGACIGALMGAVHGWEAFPESWRQGVEVPHDLVAGAGAGWIADGGW